VLLVNVVSRASELDCSVVLSEVGASVDMVVVLDGALVSGSVSCSKLSEFGGGPASGHVIRGQHSPGMRSMIHLSPAGFTYGHTLR